MNYFKRILERQALRWHARAEALEGFSTVVSFAADDPDYETPLALLLETLTIGVSRRLVVKSIDSFARTQLQAKIARNFDFQRPPRLDEADTEDLTTSTALVDPAHMTELAFTHAPDRKPALDLLTQSLERADTRELSFLWAACAAGAYADSLVAPSHLRASYDRVRLLMPRFFDWVTALNLATNLYPLSPEEAEALEEDLRENSAAQSIQRIVAYREHIEAGALMFASHLPESAMRPREFLASAEGAMPQTWVRHRAAAAQPERRRRKAQTKNLLSSARDDARALPTPEPIESKVRPEHAKSEGKKRFVLPQPELLAQPRQRTAQVDAQVLHDMSRRIESTLAGFGVQGEVLSARPGPVVTLFEFEPAIGVKSSRVIGLSDDIARAMNATAARIAVIPGRNAIGIELPNTQRETVFLNSLLNSASFVGTQGDLPLALGETIEGTPFASDLTKMPHLLIAGTTGSGKSVGINAMILSLLYKRTPDECRFIMIDPKMLELSVYEGIPHLLHPVVTDPKKAVVALKWVVREMEDRYRRMSKLGVRNISGYNERVGDVLKRGDRLERTVHAGFDPASGEPIYETRELPLEPMPYIVVVIDEMADLMITAGKEIEAAVQRLAQMARAAGIHVIMATQRPSVDVITGTIKANFPTRISYQVTSKIDSRTILGEQGAEQLLGQGDLLFMAGGGRIRRLHGPYVTELEVERVVDMLKAQGAPQYRTDVTAEPNENDGSDEPELFADDEGGGDELLERAIEIVQRDRKASTSYLQRRLSIGYNRAATLIERMEKAGIISTANAAGKRDILIDELDEDL